MPRSYTSLKGPYPGYFHLGNFAIPPQQSSKLDFGLHALQRAMALPDQFVLEIDLENTALVETLGPFDLQSALSGNSKKLEFRQARMIATF